MNNTSHLGAFYCDQMDSPIGCLTIEADAQGICSIQFPNRTPPGKNIVCRPNYHTQQAIDQLEAYFNDQLTVFDLCVHWNGTPFQERVWAQLQRVTYGSTASYLQIAKAIGHPSAYRAVGSANGKNPIPIVVPCHRIIANNGSLGGFAGGLETKQWLLTHEQRCQ